MNQMTRSDLKVRTLDAGSAVAWDDFVDACPEATFFHRAGWRNVIENSFGHQCHYLIAERGGRITGVLPLTHIRSRLFGNALISNAFCVYGGAACNDDEARTALAARAKALAVDLGVDYLEYRNRKRAQGDLPCKSDLYVAFRKSLDPDPAKNLLAIPRKQRAMVRRGAKLGLQADSDDDVTRFTRIYGASVRNLGTPVFGKPYFRALKQQFGEDCQIVTVTKDGKAISSVMSFAFRDEIHPYYGGGTSEARSLAANDFMYWEVMRRAVEGGFRTFDFGRSKRGTGSFAFKKHWGFEPEPLHYEYVLLHTADIPEINPLNPKYRAFIALWKRLPLPVANAIGPHLARNFG